MVSSHSFMSPTVATALLLAISFIIWYTWKLKKLKAMKHPLPPGPRGLPLVGNLPFIDPQLHTYFAKLSDQYGPVFKLKLGSKLLVVLCSASSVKEAIKDKDKIFATRFSPRVAVTITYGGLGLAWSPYGVHWRAQRTICVREILSKTNLDNQYMLQKREIRRTVKLINSKAGTAIDIPHYTFLASLNVMLSILWGGTVHEDESSSTGRDFQQAIAQIVELIGKPNVSDYFPILARFDIQGIEQQGKKVFLWFDRLLSSIIVDRIKHNKAIGGNKGTDFLDIILELKDKQDPKTPVSILNIKALFQDMLVGATESTAATVEWVITELMRHPNILKKIHEELKKVVGEENIVEMCHMPKLQYLEAVIKETHRLHPVVPFLIPRCPTETCIIDGYTIPKDTLVMVNVFALQMDPEVWENPKEFVPERFLDGKSKWDYSGNNVSYIPFGSGRRVCAGLPLAERTVPYALASLLHSFDWSLPAGAHLDFSTKTGISQTKKTPLLAIPTPRLSSPELYL